MQLNVTYTNGILTLDDEQVADLLRLSTLIPAIPTLVVDPPVLHPGESTSADVHILPSLDAVAYELEELQGESWVFSGTLIPGSVSGIGFTGSKTIRAVAIGYFNAYRRNGAPITVVEPTE